MQIAVTELFTCTPETLWEHITEPEKQKLWMKGLLSNEQTSPAPVGVGSTFRMVIKEGRKLMGCSFWVVTPSGNYTADCETGKKLAIEYLEFIRRAAFPLQWIVFDMPREAERTPDAPTNAPRTPRPW